MPIVDIKGVGQAQFPDEMPISDIRNFLRKKYSQQAIQGQSDILAPAPQTIEAYEPTLSERMGQGVSDALYNTGIVSDRYGAQRIGSNVAALGEMLPGVGDATAGDEFGRSLAQGDKFGMAMAGLGVIPVAGDVAKKAIRAKRNRYLYGNNKSLLNDDNTLSDNYLIGKDDFIDGLDDLEISELDEFENSGWLNTVEVDLNGEDKKRVIDDLNSSNLYHGSPNEDLDELELRSNGSLFLTHDKSAAEHYSEGGKIYNQKVNVKNPLFVETTDLTADMEGSGLFQELVNNGYDSIVPLDKGDIVILDKAAIKLKEGA